MEDTDLNIRLAQAIGWPLQHMKIVSGKLVIGVGADKQIFDYLDPKILWPLAATYDAFPFESADLRKGGWIASSGKSSKVRTQRAETAEKATAMAIIEAAKYYKPWQNKGISYG